MPDTYPDDTYPLTPIPLSHLSTLNLSPIEKTFLTSSLYVAYKIY